MTGTTVNLKTASSGLSIKDNADRIGGLCYLQHNGQYYVLGQRVDHADANETKRLWKLAQGILDKPTEHPGRDVRELLHVEFNIEEHQTRIYEVRMTPLRDSLPPGHTERKGFRNTLTTWVAVEYLGHIGDILLSTRPNQWILARDFLDHCQEFKVPNYAEVLKLLDDLLNRPASH